MRPGQSCPGVGDIPSISATSICVSFNEAGAIMPRSGLRDRRIPWEPPASFNEAGAIMPRSGWAINSFNATIKKGFNEAGAIMPRSGAQKTGVSADLMVLQ